MITQDFNIIGQVTAIDIIFAHQKFTAAFFFRRAAAQSTSSVRKVLPFRETMVLTRCLDLYSHARFSIFRGHASFLGKLKHVPSRLLQTFGTFWTCQASKSPPPSSIKAATPLSFLGNKKWLQSGAILWTNHNKPIPSLPESKLAHENRPSLKGKDRLPNHLFSGASC